MPRGLADGIAVEHQLAAVGPHQVQQQAGQGGFAAAALADDAERLALEQGERDAIDRAHDAPLPSRP